MEMFITLAHVLLSVGHYTTNISSKSQHCCVGAMATTIVIFIELQAAICSEISS